MIEMWLARCPKCHTKVGLMEPQGFSSAEAHCEVCGVDWRFFISAQESGTFVIWVDDEAEDVSGKATGHIELKELNWEWR